MAGRFIQSNTSFEPDWQTLSVFGTQIWAFCTGCQSSGLDPTRQDGTWLTDDAFMQEDATTT
jgi:hypothetical protein